ncbi:MAG: hypothetical protein IKK09_10425 [Clostridia bacterium]|nr:hypothetical protein [Clostridia bacterium]
MERKENMKILFRGISLSGGAPKSVFQHLRILKQDGHHISVIIQGSEQYLKELYESEFESLTLLPDVVALFRKRRFTQLYRQLCREYKALKSSRPDLVIAFGCAYPFFYGRFCSELQIPCIQLVAGGDLSDNELYLKGGEWCHAIGFSEENREVLRRYTHDKNISVIPNRIALKTKFDSLPEHLATVQKGINILLTSRVAGGKYESITNFIDNLCRAADGRVKINLAVAGGGEKLEQLKKYVSGIDNPFVNIEIKGHLDNLIPEFEKAHLVVGKGRSVLEPVMMNRPGCVIGDDGKIEPCTPENFDRLYRHNFSGRGLVCEDPVAVIKEVLASLANNTVDIENIFQTAQLAREYYSAEFLREKLYAALDSADFRLKKKMHIPVILRLLKFTLVRFKQKMKNKKK